MGVGVSDDLLQPIASRLHYKINHLPIQYLGMPISVNSKSKVVWNPIVEKFVSKLSRWKSQHLSLGGRITLIKSTLSNLPMYYICLSSKCRSE